MPRNPDNYETAECPSCNSTVYISKETLERATSFQVKCDSCGLWLKAAAESNNEKVAA